LSSYNEFTDDATAGKMTSPPLSRERVARVVKALPVLIGHGSAVGEVLDIETMLPQLLKDYFQVIEIAHFVRRGGVAAMVYRLETGKTKFSPEDYLDRAHDRLLADFREIYKPEPRTPQSLLQILKETTPEQESAVKDVLPLLDALMLAEKHKQSAEVDRGPGTKRD
jgi:hypothetical protein